MVVVPEEVHALGLVALAGTGSAAAVPDAPDAALRTRLGACGVVLNGRERLAGCRRERRQADVLCGIVVVSTERVVVGPHTRLHERVRVGDLDATGAYDADGLEVLGGEYAAKATLTRAVAGIVYERGHGAVLFGVRAGRDDRRVLGRSTRVTRRTHVDPAVVLLARLDTCPDLFLGLAGVEPPQVCGVLQLHIAVDDVEPYLLGGLARDHDAVPPGELQLGRETTAKVGTGEPADRVGLDADALNLRAARHRRRERTGERRCHERDDVAGVGSLDRLVLAQVEEDRGTHTVSAAPGLVLLCQDFIECAGGQIHFEDLP